MALAASFNFFNVFIFLSCGYNEQQKIFIPAADELKDVDEDQFYNIYANKKWITEFGCTCQNSHFINLPIKTKIVCAKSLVSWISILKSLNKYSSPYFVNL